MNTLHIEIAFWLSIGILVYTYLGYGMLIGIWQKLKPQKELPINFEELPEITVLIAAYNEADCISEKISNTLACTYPKEKINLWVVTDGSTDQTASIVSSFKEVRLFHQNERRGKLHAVHRVMKQVNTPITIFSDANAMLPADALLHLVKHFQNPKVGVVAGEKRVEMQNDAVSNESVYWKYESMLKKWGSRIGSATGAAGELFAIRSNLYTEVPADTLIEDFVLSLQTVQQGYQIAYEPKAYALESASASVSEEMTRKVRIAAGGLQASWRMRSLLNPFKYGVFSWQLASHRIMRWTLAPLALLIAFFANIHLHFSAEGLYTWLLLGQFVMYYWALLGKAKEEKNAYFRGFFIPYYFLMMNVCVYLGGWHLLKNKQSVVWEKALRKQSLSTHTH